MSLYEKRTVLYQDLVGIEQGTSTEPFEKVQTPEDAPLFGKYDVLTDMVESFPEVPVRQVVLAKLRTAATNLQQLNPELQLQVTYGYRSPEIQKKYYDRRALRMFGRLELTEEEKEVIHLGVAVPEVAGHPTGGAVDVRLVNSVTSENLDMGANMYDLEDENIETFAPNITEEQRQNRMLLRTIMMGEGFAPFDGEWWHFSYGDKEWAFYYGEKQAIYPQVDEIWVQKLLEAVIFYPYERKSRN